MNSNEKLGITLALTGVFWMILIELELLPSNKLSGALYLVGNLILGWGNNDRQ